MTQFPSSLIIISDVLQVTGGTYYLKEMAQERRSMTKSFRFSRAMEMLTYWHSPQSQKMSCLKRWHPFLRMGGNGNEREREK